MLFTAADFNAKIGPMEVLYSFNSVTNRNGQQLTDFTDQFDLTATRTRFKKRPGKLWTYIYPNRTIAQLDYILAKKKWGNSIKDSCAYSTFDSVGSDHRIVTCKGQISCRKTKPPEKDPMKLTDWKTTALDNDLQKHYAATVYNRFQTPMNESTDLLCENRCNNLIKANNEITSETLHKKRKNKGIFSNNKNIQKAREELTSAAAKNRIRLTRYTK